MKTILIVEDDVDTAFGYHLMLEAHGYATFRALDGVSAIREALEHQPDLMILDLGLPSGCGFDVLEWFRGSIEFSKLPIIVVTGLPVHMSQERAYKAGASAYLQKPHIHDELLACVSELIGADASV